MTKIICGALWILAVCTMIWGMWALDGFHTIQWYVQAGEYKPPVTNLGLVGVWLTTIVFLAMPSGMLSLLGIGVIQSGLADRKLEKYKRECEADRILNPRRMYEYNRG